MEHLKGKLYKVENVSKIFGNRYVLNDISFNINCGEIFGIIGTSGSGKTTLLNSLVGFIKVDKGNVKFRNVNTLDAEDEESFRSIYKHQKELKQLYGFAAQTPSFYPNLTVNENLHYFAMLYNLSKESIKSNVAYLLNLVELTQSQHIAVKKLSGGMQRRLDIACSLVHDPKILFLDEPTADLDPVLSNKIWNLIRTINQRGTTVILSSHHVIELENLCSRIAVLKDGGIVALGKPKDIKNKSLPEERIYVKSLPGNYKKIIKALKKIVGKEIERFDLKDGGLILHSMEQSRIINDVIRTIEDLGEKIITIESVKPTLDQAFIAIHEKSSNNRRRRRITVPKKGKKQVKKKEEKVKKKTNSEVKKEKKKQEKDKKEKKEEQTRKRQEQKEKKKQERQEQKRREKQEREKQERKEKKEEREEQKRREKQEREEQERREKQEREEQERKEEQEREEQERKDVQVERMEASDLQEEKAKIELENERVLKAIEEGLRGLG